LRERPGVFRRNMVNLLRLLLQLSPNCPKWALTERLQAVVI
jgi:hypothetical protein